MIKNRFANSLISLSGIGLEHISHRERLVSALGGFLGILAILLISLQFLPAGSSAFIVSSMGASAVLLFAVPQGRLSQPWALIGGHTLSALVGVTCAFYINNDLLAAPLAVGLAIAAMHYARCIHPPGGATALTAVVGGSAVTEMGYQFVITPVLLNAFVLLIAAILVNAMFSWRRYPAALSKLEKPEHAELDSRDLQYALQKMDLLIDVTGDDLNRIYELAREHAKGDHVPVEDIKLGKYYCNGEYGESWSVRRVIDESESQDGDNIIYRVVAGMDRRKSGVCSREDFARWARYEVYLNENSWHRANPETA